MGSIVPRWTTVEIWLVSRVSVLYRFTLERRCLAYGS